MKQKFSYAADFPRSLNGQTVFLDVQSLEKSVLKIMAERSDFEEINNEGLTVFRDNRKEGEQRQVVLKKRQGGFWGHLPASWFLVPNFCEPSEPVL